MSCVRYTEADHSLDIGPKIKTQAMGFLYTSPQKHKVQMLS